VILWGIGLELRLSKVEKIFNTKQLEEQLNKMESSKNVLLERLNEIFTDMKTTDELFREFELFLLKKGFKKE